MNKNQFVLATTDSEFLNIATLAEEIWNQHFVPIIGQAQVDYMLDKFQSYHAIKKQIEKEGYEYYQLYSSHTLVGYVGIHPEENSLFLSKLYVKKDFRGQHLATEALKFLVGLCRERGLGSIWLTCNKDNRNTLAIYNHLGFQITNEQVADIGNGFVMDDYILTYTIS